MNKFFRIALVLSLVFCLAIVFVACNPAGKGGETTPAPTTPVETTPVATTPVETTPVATTPVETTPVATTPVETTPAETTTTAGMNPPVANTETGFGGGAI